VLNHKIDTFKKNQVLFYFFIGHTSRFKQESSHLVAHGLEVHASEDVIMRHYLFIWLGIAACFAFIQIDHAMLAVLSLMVSWVVALFVKPSVQRDTFSSMYMSDALIKVESSIQH